ncbi:MAG: ribulose-phosphate 3-epimerase [Candidatus Margulisiibacteriota bacterium]
MIKIAASILSADFSRLGEEVKKAEEAGADMIHVDVMDGHFVPNITMGPLVVKAIKKMTRLPLDVHLMIKSPEKYIRQFAEAGSNIISFHTETVSDPVNVIAEIKKYGSMPAIAVNPDSDLSASEEILKDIKMVLFMTVFPGFEGQKFMPEVLPKIRNFKEMTVNKRLNIDIEVDGGINIATARQAMDAGANVLVAGSAIFYAKSYKTAIGSIRNAK